MQKFRGSGLGGQHRNKTESGVRIIHRASGARGESCDTRSQHENKRIAFRRMAESPTFQRWARGYGGRDEATERQWLEEMEKLQVTIRTYNIVVSE